MDTFINTFWIKIRFFADSQYFVQLPFLFSVYLKVNKCSINVADDWIRSWVLWYLVSVATTFDWARFFKNNSGVIQWRIIYAICKVKKFPFIFLLVGLFAVEIFISLTVAVVAITSSAIACRAVCCRRPKASGSPVLYNVNGFQGQQGQILLNFFCCIWWLCKLWLDWIGTVKFW